MAQLADLFAAGERRIRQPKWHDRAYLRLYELPAWPGRPEVPRGGLAPWARLFDAPGQQACGIPVGSQSLSTLLGAFADDPSWEPYVGEPRPEEANYTDAGAEKPK